MSKNIVIVGLGAIGSVYATAIQDAGTDNLRIAVDHLRKERYQSQGFVFNGKKYDFNYFTPAKGDPMADLVIIATKSNGYNDALKLIEAVVGEKTQILPLLNGITSEKIAAAKYGWSRVLYGYFIGHTASCNRRSCTQDGHYQTVVSHSELLKEVFDNAGIHYQMPDDIISSLWQKFIINIGTNQPTARYNMNYGEQLSSPTVMLYSTNLMNEAASIAVKLEIRDAENMVAKALKMMQTMRADDRSSMLQDVDAGRPTEIDLFAGEVVRLGQQLGIPTPLHQELLRIFN